MSAPVDGYLFSWNDQLYPVNLPVVEPILQQNDPILYTVCGFIQNLINNYMSPSFAQEAAHVKLTTANGVQYVGTGALGSLLNFPLNPTILQSESLQFPLVSVYRETEEDEHFTLAKVMVKSNFVIQYVLPPLTAPQHNRLYSFLHLFNEIIVGFFFQGFDPLYHNSELVFKDAGLSFLTINSAKYEPIVAMTDKNSLFFPTVSIRFSAHERKKFVLQNYEALTDIFIEVDMVEDGYAKYPILNFADGYVESNIAITSFSPSTGPVAGNTPVAIQGAGFGSNIVAGVTVAGIPATIGRHQNNLLIVFTGPVLGTAPPPGPIVITDTGGTIYTSSGNYTYV